MQTAIKVLNRLWRERSLVRVPVGPCAFSSPVTFGGQYGGPCSGYEQQTDCLVGSVMVPSRFGDGSYLAGRNCHRSTVWPDSSVVRVLARSARGPGFESRSRAMCFFLPCDTCNITVTYVTNILLLSFIISLFECFYSVSDRKFVLLLSYRRETVHIHQ